jgi:hypothetical protein
VLVKRASSHNGRDTLVLDYYLKMALARLPPLALAAFLYYGAFSRLTHGAYTPQFYAYQTDRYPDDGSPVATAAPIMDLAVGSLLLAPRQRVRFWGAVGFVCMHSVGLVMQLRSGKDYSGDALWMGVGVLSVFVI